MTCGRYSEERLSDEIRVQRYLSGMADPKIVSAPQGSPRTPAKCIAATTPGLIVRILKFWF